MSVDCLGQTCLVPSLTMARRLQKKKLRRKKVGQSALQRVFSRLFLRVGCSLLYKAGFVVMSVAHFQSFCAGGAKTIPGVSGNEEVSTGVESVGQLRGRHIVVPRSLVLLTGGPTMMSSRLSTVEVGDGTCWSRRLMIVIFGFK